MGKTLKFAVADDEPRICRMIAQLVDREGLDLSLCGTATDGEMLLELIRREKPDIVISDIYMPKMDGLEVLRQIKQEGLPCRYIMVTGYKQFDYAYTALKYSVDDFILKPVDADVLNGTLAKIARDLRKQGGREKEPDSSLRRLLISGDMSRITPGDTVERLNQLYGTSFRDGRFRFVVVKQDYDLDEAEAPDQLTSLQSKIEDMLEGALGPMCHDAVFDQRISGICGLINYSEEAETALKDALEGLMREVNLLAGFFPGMVITMGISRPVFTPGEFAEASAGAADALGIRRIYGTGKLYWQPEREAEIPPSYESKLKVIRERILKSYESLDEPEFSRAIDELFDLPETILTSSLARGYLKEFLYSLFEEDGELIRKSFEKEDLLEEILWDVENAYTMETYHRVLRDWISRILLALRDYAANQSSRVVRKSIQYITENFTREIGVEEAARFVNLSTGYFSSIFKRETGKTFTEYVTQVRMERARELLRNSSYNINEVADAVGMPNARYFSKQFKKSVGLTPKEFRQIHG